MSENSGDVRASSWEFLSQGQEATEDALLRAMRSIEQESGELNAAIVAEYQYLDGFGRRQVDEALSSYRLARHDAREQEQKQEPSPRSSYLAGKQIPRSLVDSYARLEVAEHRMAVVESRLDSPQIGKAEKVFSMLAQVELSLDYEQIVRTLVMPEGIRLRQELGFVVGARRMIGQGVRVGYRQLRDIELIAKLFAKEWRTQSLVCEKEANVSAMQEVPEGASGEIGAVIGRIDRAEELQQRYGSRLPGVGTGFDVRAVASGLKHTLCRHSAQTIEELRTSPGKGGTQQRSIRCRQNPYKPQTCYSACGCL